MQNSGQRTFLVLENFATCWLYVCILSSRQALKLSTLKFEDDRVQEDLVVLQPILTLRSENMELDTSAK